MTPTLSPSFCPTASQVPHLLYTLVCLLCCNLLIFFPQRGEISSEDQGHTGDGGLFTELQSQAPSSPLCHRDGCPGDTTRRGSPQRDRPWGVFAISLFFISSPSQESDKSEEGCLSSSSSFIPGKIREWFDM